MRILISHAHEDAAIAALLSNLFERATSRQIRVWFSSDESAAGGISPGLWYERLRTELSQTNAVIALITPNSIDTPWLYFEAGFGAADTQKKIIPVYLGLKLDAIGMPLSGYQLYDLSSQTSFRSLVAKVFHEARVEYFSDVHDGPRDTCYAALVAAERNLFDDVRPSKDNEVLHQIAALAARMDRNLYELSKQLPGPRSPHFDAYEVPVRLVDTHGKSVRSFHVRLESGMSVQDFATEVYLKIGDYVGPYEYLTSWIAVDPVSQKKFVIREVASLIPAELLFKQGQDYEAHLLARPYDPTTDSQPEILS